MFKVFNALNILKDSNEGLNLRLDFLAVNISLVKTGGADLNKSQCGFFCRVDEWLVFEDDLNN